MPEGEQFLHKKYSDLHTSEPVEHEQERRKIAGEETTQKPAEKIADFLEVIKRTHGHEDNPVVMEKIREYYHKEYVIKPEEVPESYFDNQKRIAREQGHGDIEITEEMRKQLIEVIIADQESTLDNWVTYLSSKDADAYPMWARYWAFKSMLKLSTYDKEKKEFSKRKKDTVAPFPDLNREALATVVDIINKKANKEKIQLAEDSPELQNLINQENFGKLYAYAIEKITPTEVNELETTTGEWVKYKQGSDHMPLVKSLQGFGTGWCTAGESTAQAQLKGGDFYVYYSHNKDNKPIIPRVAIRMEENKIGEVRGIAPEQNLDPFINDVVDKKLDEFPDGKEYQKKVEDMKRLTEIDNKTKQKQELTKDDLRFIYEIDKKIKGFGYQKDPRIEELQETRNIKKDLALVFDCSENQISTTREEALKGNIKYHYRDLYFGRLTSAEGLKLPKSVGGSLNLRGLTSAKGLKLPESVGGDLYLGKLTLVKRLKLSESVGGDLDLGSLTLAKRLKLPESVGGNLYLGSLTSAEGLKLPESVGDGLDLRGLTSAEELKLPESVGGSLNFGGLTSAEGLKLPESVGGGLYLGSLTSAEGLKLPKSVGGYLDLRSLTSAEELKLPESVRGYLILKSLASTEKEKLRRKYPQLRII